MCLRNAARRRMLADAKAIMETHASVTRRWAGVSTAVHFERMAYVGALGRILRDGYAVRAERRRVNPLRHAAAAPGCI